MGILRRCVAIVFLAIVGLGLAGCNSNRVAFPPVILDRADRVLNAIDRALSDDDVARAAGVLSTAVERNVIDSHVARGQYVRLLSHLRDAYTDSIETGQFRQALTHLRSLQLLIGDPLALFQEDPEQVEWWNEMFLPHADFDRLRLAWVDAEIAQDAIVPALEVLRSFESFKVLTTDRLVELLRLSDAVNNNALTQRLAAEIAQRGHALPAGMRIETDEAIQQMLSGTVTIWVNRGIRIRDGVGVPDRVIGSGFFVDPRGYLITNYHVISSEVDPTFDGFSRLFVKLPGRGDQRVPARVVGYDRVFDLALLKVEVDPRYVFSFSDVRRLRPGQTVFALGSPGGLDSTITSGIVSAEGRRFLQMGEAMQVDAAVNPGNSGGPLVLPNGQVAGVVFAGIEQFEGVNFAVPAHWIRYVFLDLFQAGEVKHAWIGAAVRRRDDGLHVIYVVPDSPAALSGLMRGEVITAIGGRSITEIEEAHDLLLGLDAGQIVAVEVKDSRHDERRTRIVGLANRPFSPVEEALKRDPIESLFPVLFGMEVDLLRGPIWSTEYIITNVYPGGIADESSLSVDDPFALRNWRVDRDLRAAFIQIIIKKRKAGFLEMGVQLGSYLEVDLFI